MMAGNPIIEHYSMPQPQFAAESLDLSGTRIRAQATAAASLLRSSLDVLSPSEHQEDSAAWTGSDWEQISLAIHRLRTNGVYYRLGKNATVKEWVQCNTTCHMDIFPSLFHYLIGEDLMQPVLQGQSIFREDRWPFTLIARFNASRVPYEYCIHNDKNKLIFALSNDTDPFSSRELKILSKRNLHDDTLPQDASALQEEFGPALKHLFPSPMQ